jgi:hypothetical protein
MYFLSCRFVQPLADGQVQLDMSFKKKVQLDMVGSLCVCIFGTIFCLSFFLVSTCFLAIFFLTICFLQQFQLGTEPEDFGVNWNSSIRTRKMKGLSAPGKLARQHDSCGKIVLKKHVSFADWSCIFCVLCHNGGNC